MYNVAKHQKSYVIGVIREEAETRCGGAPKLELAIAGNRVRVKTNDDGVERWVMFKGCPT